MSKREDIIQGTIDLVAKNGIANTPTIKIAKYSGAAEYTLFRLFGSKDVLLNEVFSNLVSRFHQACEEEVVSQGGIKEQFKSLLTFTAKYYRENPNELSYIQQYISSPIGTSKRPDIRCEEGEDVSNFPMLNLLALGRSQGAFKNLSVPTLASISVETVYMFLREEQIRNIKHSQEELELLIEACWHGVKA